MQQLRRIYWLAIMLLLVVPVWSDNEELSNQLEYNFERQITFGNGNNPLWLNANKYGLSSLNSDNGYVRFGVDGKRYLGLSGNWCLTYGADVALAYNFTSSVVVQQLYAGITYKKVGLYVGSKQHPANLKNAELSSGSQTFGINARPIPEVRIEAPNYFPILRNKKWLSMKFHFAYGMVTDKNRQRDFISKALNNTNYNYFIGDLRYTNNYFYHSKSGFLKIGDEEKYPLVAEGGLEWGGQFGGTSHNVNVRNVSSDVKSGNGVKDFVKIIYGGGSDPTDYYKNAEGNSLGSWMFSLSYKFKNNAKIRLYLDHFFEDHSQIFLDYGWNDGLYGLELTLPKNRFVSSFVYEYMRTKTQSGPLYHDGNDIVPDQISAMDNYYNHSIFTGWQHWGQAIGNPFFTAPLYNEDHTIRFLNNRFFAHHFGIAGNPTKDLHYRLLCSYSTNWGTYQLPFDDKKYNTSFLAEVTWSPKRLGNWRVDGNSLKCGFAFDKGKLLGNNTGFQITLCSKGLFNLKNAER